MKPSFGGRWRIIKTENEMKCRYDVMKKGRLTISRKPSLLFFEVYSRRRCVFDLSMGDYTVKNQIFGIIAVLHRFIFSVVRRQVFFVVIGKNGHDNRGTVQPFRSHYGADQVSAGGNTHADPQLAGQHLCRNNGVTVIYRNNAV